MLRKYFLEVPEPMTRNIVDRLASFAYLKIMEYCPSSEKSGRGYRGPPLRLSIKREEVDGGKGVLIGPTKTVDGIDLGTMLEQGSASHSQIRPKLRGSTAETITLGIQQSYYRQVSGEEFSPLGGRKRIYPKKGPYLSFYYQGRRYRIKSVKRGSIAPRRFVQRASEDLISAWNEIVIEGVSEYLEAHPIV